MPMAMPQIAAVFLLSPVAIATATTACYKTTYASTATGGAVRRMETSSHGAATCTTATPACAATPTISSTASRFAASRTDYLIY